MAKWKSIFGAIFVVSVGFSAFLFYQSHHQKFHDPFEIYRPNSLAPPIRRYGSLEPVTVLLYSQYGGIKKHWTSWDQTGLVVNTPNYLGSEIRRQGCSVPCTITTDKAALGSADAVVLEGIPRDESSVWEWLRVPMNLPQKRPGQYWVNFGYDNEDHFPLLRESVYMAQFDVNMTYSQKPSRTSVPVSLFCNWAGGSVSDFQKSPPSKKDDKLVAFVMHDCKHGRGKGAVAYIKELMKYIKVDAYGDCLHNTATEPLQPSKPEDFGQAVAREIEIYADYKFVLAFEINNLTDFVTEKLALAFKAGSVPVYMGAPNVDDWLPGDHSIINTNDFNSPKALADYLNRLQKNDKEYKEYFAWKSKGLSDKFQDKLAKCVFDGADCRLCTHIAKRQQEDSDMAFGNTVIRDRSYALSFDGKSTYVEVGDFPELRLDDGYTLSAWIYMESMEDWRIVDKNTAGRVDGWSMDVLKKGSRGFIRLCTSGGCWMGMKPLSTGNWYHVAATFISSHTPVADAVPGINFYVNGKHDYYAYLPKNEFGIGPAEQNNLPMRIGRSGEGTQFWHGMIDDVSIWNRPLSAGNIRKLMYQRLGGNEPGLVGYWSFNEGQGSIVYDYSKNRHHGRVLGVSTNWIPSETKEMILHKCV